MIEEAPHDIIEVMNLTAVSKLVKKGAKYVLLVVFGYYLIVYVIFPTSVSIFRALFIPKEPTNTAFGQLEPLEFTEKPITNENPEFVLNTQNGRLPNDLPDRMKVYKFKPQQFSYLAGKNAIADADMLGFAEKDLITDLKGDTFKWRDSELNSLLTIELDTKRLELETNMNKKTAYYTPGNIDETNAVEIAKTLFVSIYRLDDPLYNSTGFQRVKLGKISGNRIFEAVDKREAQVALVDFFRTIDDYMILGQDPSKGLLRCIVRKPTSAKTPLNNPMVEAAYWEIEPETTAIYPIISVKDAWDAVSTGRGVIASIIPKGTNPFEDYTPVQVQKILIDNIYLAYYETINYQKYLQPIYVFEGTYTTSSTNSGNIVLYFPAITGEFRAQSNNQTQSQE